jgi:hypothetical protein
MRGHDGDPLLHDGDVAAQEEPEAAEPLLALGELGEARGGRERAQGAGDDPPADGDQILVVEIEELRVVIGVERPPLRSRPGQRDERRIVHRTLPRLGEGAPHAFAGEVGGLRPEAEARPGRVPEDHLEPDPVGRGGLGLLDPVRGQVRRVGEPREQLPVGRDECLGLEDVGRAAEELERFPRGAREIGRRGSEAQGARSSWGKAASLLPTAFGLWPRRPAPEWFRAVRADGRTCCINGRR